MLRARAERSASRIFLQWEDATWNYAEAWEAIRRWAGFLRGLGAGPSPARLRVAGYLENRPDALWALLGTHAAGSV